MKARLRNPSGNTVLGANPNVEGESGLGKTKVSGGGRGRGETESSKVEHVRRVSDPRQNQWRREHVEDLNALDGDLENNPVSLAQ